MLDESFRWLGAKNKTETIERNLCKAARMNNKKEEDIVDLFRSKQGRKDQENDSQKVEDQNVTEKISPWQIFKDKEIAFVTVIIWFIWYVIVLRVP